MWRGVARWLIRAIDRAHVWLYRRSGGRLGGWSPGQRMLLLHTRGRRSGQPRVHALAYVPLDGRFVVCASYYGSDRHPDWYRNLVAAPRASIQVGTQRLPVTATVTHGAERDALWQLVVARHPVYASYQRATRRQIPVVLLTPDQT